MFQLPTHEILRTGLAFGVAWLTWRLLKYISYKDPLRNLPGPPGENWWTGKQASLNNVCVRLTYYPKVT